MNLNKILLGAAAFGNVYGVANSTALASNEIRAILNWAADHGIYGIDTAPHYGNSEMEIGSTNVPGLRVFTKFSGSDPLMQTITASILTSLQRLRRKQIQGLTIWSSQYLLSSEKQALAEIRQLLDEGLAQSWGVSVYEPQELSRILQVCQPDYVQFPFNVFDTRFLESGLLRDLNSRSIEIQIRSIFLQGILTMKSSEIPKSFRKYSHYFDLIHQLSSEANISPYSLSLSWASTALPDARLVIGVNSYGHLSKLKDEIVPLSDEIRSKIFDLKVPISLSDPRLWT